MSVELPPAATLAALKLEAAPAGRPLAVSATLPAKPLLPVTEMVEVPEEPTAVESEAGLALTPKSAVALQPCTELPTKQMLKIACSSIPLGATPV